MFGSAASPRAVRGANIVRMNSYATIQVEYA
jgi:hypothetical protein